MGEFHYMEKTTAPVLEVVVPRQRILDQIASREPSVVWIGASAGFGKTVLARQITKQFGESVFWYDVESIDEDPAIFFDMMKCSAVLRSPKCRELPDISAEQMPHLDAFAPRFFAQLAQLLGTPVTLVLDDLHNIPSTAPLHETLVNVIRKHPSKLRIVVASQSEAPPIWRRVETDLDLCFVTQSQLSVQDDELNAYLQIDPRWQGLSQREGISKAVLELSGGWITGIKLLLGHLALEPDVPVARRCEESRETVFRLFAITVFDDLDQRTQQILLKTSFLPFVPLQMVSQLTETIEAEKTLIELYEKDFFVGKRTVHASRNLTAFVYHDL